MDGRQNHIPWWRRRRAELMALAGNATPRYVYSTAAVETAIAELKTLSAVDRLFYAVKANPHPGLLQVMHAAGIGFETVSPGELDLVRGLFPELGRDRLLFTPNFAPRSEYAEAFGLAVTVTLDNLHPLREWPELLRGRELLLRVDTGLGAGHHSHVRTAGEGSKFGIPLTELNEARELVASLGARITRACMPTWAAASWMRMCGARPPPCSRNSRNPSRTSGCWIWAAVSACRNARGKTASTSPVWTAGSWRLKHAYPRLQLWLEPGRYLVARAGVLLTRVTQLKGKGALRYLGVDAGMNSLIRPALYGAHHEIVNLTRFGEPATAHYTIVGPICESGDVLGCERQLPESREGDVMLVADTGAYGHAMSSRYNLREPAGELLL